MISKETKEWCKARSRRPTPIALTYYSHKVQIVCQSRYYKT